MTSQQLKIATGVGAQIIIRQLCLMGGNINANKDVGDALNTEYPISRYTHFALLIPINLFILGQAAKTKQKCAEG